MLKWSLYFTEFLCPVPHSKEDLTSFTGVCVCVCLSSEQMTDIIFWCVGGKEEAYQYIHGQRKSSNFLLGK